MIEVKNISKSFDKKIILKNYSYSFEDNKIYCLIGESGCGKTTLLRIISGLDRPDKGEVFYNNTPIKKPSKNIFMMNQSYTNFPWKTCLENVLFPIKLQGQVREEHKKQAIDLLTEVGLEESINHYPYELSGGMKQRLALARTLMIKPEVILMDEPLSALDPSTREKMQDMIIKLHKETQNTIIMITHDHDEAEKMGDIVLKFERSV